MSNRTLSRSGRFCWIVAALASAVDAQQPTNSTAREESKPAIMLEAELERGKTVSRLILFIRNTTDAPYSFENGAHGGSGSLDDGFRFRPDPTRRELLNLEKRRTIGTAPTVVPEFEFRFGEAGRIYFRAPSFGGLFKRSARPYKVTVAPDSRVQYASFVVPTQNVSGRFVEAKLALPDDRMLRTRVLTVKAAPDESG